MLKCADGGGCAGHQVPRGHHQPRPHSDGQDRTSKASLPEVLGEGTSPTAAAGELLQVSPFSHTAPQDGTAPRRTGQLSSASLRLLIDQRHPAPQTGGHLPDPLHPEGQGRQLLPEL